MMKSQFVFAYGSHMEPAQMRERCPESDLSRYVAEARGWTLCFRRESKKRKGGVGSIAAPDGASTWGVVFAVSERDLSRLDAYEGVPKAYRRELIDVVDAAGRPSKLWTYFAIPSGLGDFTPHNDYVALHTGAVYFGLPEAYFASL